MNKEQLQRLEDLGETVRALRGYLWPRRPSGAP